MSLIKLAFVAIRSPAALALARKLGTVWIMAFVAASGGIISRRFHKEEPPRRPPRWQPPSQRRGP